MEIIWSLWLTACFTDTNCRHQDVQWFDTQQKCVEMKMIHEDIPLDGDWKAVTYKCKPVGSKEA